MVAFADPGIAVGELEFAAARAGDLVVDRFVAEELGQGDARVLITWVRTTQSRHEHFTSSRVAGTGRRATLTRAGLQHLSLITGEFGQE